MAFLAYLLFVSSFRVEGLQYILGIGYFFHHTLAFCKQTTNWDFDIVIFERGGESAIGSYRLCQDTKCCRRVWDFPHFST